MKIDEVVPTMMPKRFIQAKPASDDPEAKMTKGRLARKMVIEVPTVRLRVSLMERSIRSRSGMVLYLRRFSRMRS